MLGDRLELGLGTGYAKTEFEQAGLAFPGPGARLDHLERCLAALRSRYGDSPLPRIFLGGQRDRMLRLAAREADVVGFTGARFGFRYITVMEPGMEAFADVIAMLR